MLAAYVDRERAADAVARVAPGRLAAACCLGGNDVAFHEITDRVTSDLKRAEPFAIPILLLLSFWVFRGLIAALLPLLVGGFAILATFLLLRVVDQFLGLSIFAVNLVTGLGLGLAIDYCLFVLSRYREELASGAFDERGPIGRTLQTAGRTVLYSSLTVAGALASMLVFPLRFLYSMGHRRRRSPRCSRAPSRSGAARACSLRSGPDRLARARLAAAQPRARPHADARAASGLASRTRSCAARDRSRSSRPPCCSSARPAALRLALDPRRRPRAASVLRARAGRGTLTRDFAVDGRSRSRPRLSAANALHRRVRRAPRAASGEPGIDARRVATWVTPTWVVDCMPRGDRRRARERGLVQAAAHARRLDPPVLVGGVTAWFGDQKASIAAQPRSRSLIVGSSPAALPDDRLAGAAADDPR